jgi:hypothetical protein
MANKMDNIRAALAQLDATVDQTEIELDTVEKVTADENLFPFQQQIGEKEMAEVDTAMLASQHADIRREGAVERGELRYDIATRAGDIRREQAVGFGDTRYNIAEKAGDIRRDIGQEGQENIVATKDARHDVINEIDRQADRLDNQASSFYIAGQTNATVAARDLATLTALTEANATAMRNEIALNVEKVGAAGAVQAEKIASASALGAEKIATAVALGQAQLARDIWTDGDKTRALINDLKYHDLSRGLIERNAELVEERNWGRHWYHGANQAQFGQQFAQLQSQMQNFNSQLAETRQGMVNFGTMAGNAGQQTSTNNNVR